VWINTVVRPKGNELSERIIENKQTETHSQIRIGKYIRDIAVYILVFLVVLECAAIFKAKAIDGLIAALRPPFDAAKQNDDLGAKGVKYGSYRGIKLNKYGFNDSDDYDRDKKDRAVRIMCLGDSITFGILTPPHNWPAFLEEMLRDEGLDVEVINAAFPGNSLPSIINRFESEYLDFGPDILLVYKGFRYYMSDEEQPHKGEKSSKESIWRRVLGKSAFLKNYTGKEPVDPRERLLHKRERYGITELVTSIKEENLSRFKKDLGHLVQICKDNDITLVLSSFPSLTDESNRDRYIDDCYDTLTFQPSVSVDAYISAKPIFNARIRELAAEEGLMYVDISRGVKRNKDYFIDDYHLTVRGAKQVARNYAEALAHFIRKSYIAP